MTSEGRKAEYILRNPELSHYGDSALLKTDREDLIDLARSVGGVESVYYIDAFAIYRVVFSSLYDTEIVWLNLDYALENAVKFSATWQNSIEGLDL